LHPASGLGVHRVSRDPVPLLPKKRRSPRRHPRDVGSDPSKGSPRRQPCRITAVLAFVPLPRALHPDSSRCLPGPEGPGDRTPEGVIGTPRRALSGTPRGACTAGGVRLVTMLRFASANPHVVSMQPSTRRSGVGDHVRLSVAGPPRLECPLPSTPERAGSGEQLASRPCSIDESVAASPPLPVTKRSFLPWALVPFKVLRLPLLPDGVSGKRVAHSREVRGRTGHRADGGSSSR
jgi:hypothetical protein